MRIQTRIRLKPSGKEPEVRYTVDYKKSNRKGWQVYATVDSLFQAERLRKQCIALNGERLVLRKFEGKRLQKYRIVDEYKNDSKNYAIEYKYPFQSWHHYSNYFNSLDAAIRRCDELSQRVTNFSRFGLAKFFRDFSHTVSSSVLCIRYPFLYPRNRFTGKHYSNWKLDAKIDQLFADSHECTNYVEFHRGMTDEELEQMRHPKYRITSIRKAIECRILKIYRGFLEVLHCVPTDTEMDAMDRGWRKAFGSDLLRELKQILKKNHYLYKYRIMQIKEKWGELCWYDAAAPHEVFDMLRKYEDLSYRTCIVCGQPAKYRTRGYVLPYCEQCMPKKDIEYGSYTELHEKETGWVEIGPDEFLDSIQSGTSESTSSSI